MPKAKDTALILVLNAGSSSIKFAVFDTDLRQEIGGIVEGIGGASTIKIADQSRALPFIDHKSALSGCLLYTSPSPRDGLLSRMPSSA